MSRFESNGVSGNAGCVAGWGGGPFLSSFVFFFLSSPLLLSEWLAVSARCSGSGSGFVCWQGMIGIQRIKREDVRLARVEQNESGREESCKRKEAKEA